MSKFTDRLWREIVREHGADLRELERPSARHGRGGRMPRLLAGTGLVGVAGAGAALAIALSAAGTSPAFAVTRNGDGSYSVGISNWRAIPLANARLRALGLRAQLVRVMSDCTSAPPGAMPETQVVPTSALARAKMLAAARIVPKQIPLGRTLMVPAIKQGRLIGLAKALAVSGAVPSCLPPPMRVCFAGPQAAGGPSTTGTGTTTTGTTTIGATTTGTTTTGATTTGTTTTGATASSGTAAPGPATFRCFVPTGVACAAPGPPKGSPPKLAPAQIATMRAKIAAIRARIAQIRAKANASTTSSGTTTTGTATGPVPPPAVLRAVGAPPLNGPFSCRAPG